MWRTPLAPLETKLRCLFSSGHFSNQHYYAGQAYTSWWELAAKFAGILWASWCQVGCLKRAMVGAFTPSKMANATKKSFSSFSFSLLFFPFVVKLSSAQHCLNLSSLHLTTLMQRKSQSEKRNLAGTNAKNFSQSLEQSWEKLAQTSTKQDHKSF